MKNKIYILTPIILFMFTIFSITYVTSNSITAANGDNTYFNLDKMQNALEKYEKIAYYGGWTSIPFQEEIKRNDEGEHIALLKRRLQLTGDLGEENNINSNIFDLNLEKAVIKFQYRHGLTPTGIINKKTLQELNIPVTVRINQIKKSLNQMKEYKDLLPRKYIIVNIPDFKLKVVEDTHSVMTMKTIVGSLYNPTPVFHRKITYLVLNPSWIIPYKSSIVTILPQIKKDPDYLDKNNIKVFKGWGESSKEINSDSIKWSKIDKTNFSYRFVQDPGPSNPMGIVKFKFPNKYNVYLHGTPKPYLFDRQIRTFSAGCIRIEKPIKLAEYLLSNKPNWSPEKINEIIEKGVNKTVYLTKPFPVFIVYWPVWATEEGQIHFRKNIYNR